MSQASILICEDEAIVAADLAGTLGRLGYEVVDTTGLGEEAIEMARALRPDLVLMDIRLAGAMDGIEAAGIIRREMDLPVIFLTAHSDQATLERAKLSEPFGYLLKPFEELGLETHIEMALYKHGAEQKLRQAHDELELRVQERTRKLMEAEQELRVINETLEQRVVERTAELQAANAKLLDSRLAALNMMEDAVAARSQAGAKNEELNREIAERRRAEEELRVAKEAAEAANRAKSQFLANMSHELRTPMTGVLGMLDLALCGPLEEKQKECICMAHNSARSLLRIINDILDLTRIEAGKLTVEESLFGLHECIAGAVDILVPEARRRGIDLVSSIADDVPVSVVGDQLRLRQIITNLLGNAVKFTEKGKVEVRVVAGGLRPDGRRIISFSVADTGIGIPADKRDTIFHAFSQADDSDTRKYGGTGLGLAISREIAERMGGTISFESEEGVGSTFTVTIPFCEGGMECDAIAVPAERPFTAVNDHLIEAKEPPRLLIAEDDTINRAILGQVFKLKNFAPEFATNGREAVEKWENGSYDLVIMDVQMPLMDGLEATRTIREKERATGGHVIILAMTAHAFSEDRERCLAAGMDAYVSKPIDFNHCFGLISDLLGRNALSTN